MRSYKINQDGTNTSHRSAHEVPGGLPISSGFLRKAQLKQEVTMKIFVPALGAALVLGTASFALADDGTDMRLDTSRDAGPAIQQFKNSQVSLPQQGQTAYIDRAGAGGN
jgi:hypothetical protein